MSDRAHLSIGEVLSLLREEFPDVTISKIRFLESQGLVDPERTPSGYRKFYEPDVERLRWILRQQRENFLPLKVIRGRLSEQVPSETPVLERDGREPPVPARAGAPAHADGEAKVDEATSTLPGHPAAPVPSLFAGLHPGAGAPERPGPEKPGPERPGPEKAGPEKAAPEKAGPEKVGPERPGPERAGPEKAGRAAAPGPARQFSSRPSVPAPAPADVVPQVEPRAGDSDTFTADELAAASGAERALIEDLQQYGLISPLAMVAGTAYFDESSVAISRCAAELARHGVEARHLRIWRNAADREADLFQQIVLPLLRQRNPHSRRQAQDTLDELARTGRDLRTALVERALREIH